MEMRIVRLLTRNKVIQSNKTTQYNLLTALLHRDLASSNWLSICFSSVDKFADDTLASSGAIVARGDELP